MRSEESTFSVKPKSLIWRAFFAGALIHVVLWGLSFMSTFAIIPMFALALPGLMVDMSAEMLHPGPIEATILVLVATVVNGSAYALGAWIFSKVQKPSHSQSNVQAEK